MDRETVARILILQYLNQQSTVEHTDDINGVIDILSAVWNLPVPELVEGSNTLTDFIPSFEDKEQTVLKTIAASKTGEGSFDEAFNILKHTLEMERSPDNLNRIAGVCLKRGNFQEAVDYCQQCLEIDPNNELAASRLSFAYWSLNRKKEATDVFNSLEGKPTQSGLTFVNDKRQPFQSTQAAIAAEFELQKNNPALQELLEDPEMADLIGKLKTNPNEIYSLMGDPKLLRLMSVLMDKSMK